MNEIQDIQQKQESYTYPLPGYYSYVEKEVEDVEILKNYHFIFDICRHIVYGTALNDNDALQFFIRNGIHVLCDRVIHLLNYSFDSEERTDIESVVTYWYNRQLFIQLTSIPKLITDKRYYSIPIKREPDSEVQIDILALNKYFREINYSIRYLVVIVDTYSRYVWAHPVEILKPAEVADAIQYALNRPGLSKEYYVHMKPYVKRVVYDGGSEFKKDFASTSIPRIFNQNTDSIVAPPKNQTFGRPTRTGPIESAIAELRKIMRDYSLEISTNIFDHDSEGLTRILNQYNQFSRIAILENNAPANVVLELMGKHADEQKLKEQEEEEGYEIHDEKIKDIPKHNQHQALLQQQLFRKEQNQYPIITNTNQGYGYRLFIPQGPFPKQVDIRVSTELYHILPGEYNYGRVNLKNFSNEKRKKDIPWQSLVLVKTPVEEGPSIIEKHIKQEETNDVQIIPKNIIKPYKITKQIVQAASGRKEKIVISHSKVTGRPIFKNHAEKFIY